MEPALAELRQRLAEVEDLARARQLLSWDLEVCMPAGGQPARAAQLGTLEGVLHDRMTDDRIGELVEELEPYAESLPHDHEEACLVRVARYDWELARRIPTALAVELEQTAAEAFPAWARARESSDFTLFRPWLERMVEISARWGECALPGADPYDGLLERWEPGLRTGEVRRIFDTLQPELVSLVDTYATEDEDDFLQGPFDIPVQDRLSREIVESFGGTWDAFRLDPTVHPFMAAPGRTDLRLTTRYHEGNLNSLFNAMHECGHALVEWGVDPALERSTLDQGASSTIHESQSRLWENVVGRSLPFWRWFHPRLREAYPARLGDVSAEELFRAFNRVRRSFVRVDADETSYGLHVILRFELEQELVAGRLAVDDLPETWNARFRELLGLEVPDDRLGVLQDVHWSGGMFGYFPTYLLGTVLSVQVWETLRDELPDVEEQIERGNFGPLHEWLRENLYSLGRSLTPTETIARVVGGPLDPEPYLAYLREKLAATANA